MSHFYGTVQGNRSEATRCGHKEGEDPGMVTWCASWEGSIRCEAWYNKKEKEDWVTVTKERWRGIGEVKLLYEGPIGIDKKKERAKKVINGI